MVQTRYAARQSRISWDYLPLEIRFQILESFTPGGNLIEGVGYLASVSQEWRDFFERYTFKKLQLDGSSLAGFGKAIQRRPIRLDFIRNVCLRISLTHYDCSCCKEKEDMETIARNDKIFLSSLRSLLNVLALWQPSERGYAEEDSRIKGLTLEISAASSSDRKHSIFFCQQKDTYPFRYEEDLAKSPGLEEYHRRRLRSAARHPSPPVDRTTPLSRVDTVKAMLRFDGNPLHIHSKAPVLPQTPIVTGLLLRHRTCRSIEIKSLAHLMRESLVALRWFRFERRHLGRIEERKAVQQLIGDLIPSLPSTLESFFVYHDYINLSGYTGAPREYLQTLMAKAMAYNPSCPRLKEFGSTWQIRPSMFFHQLGVIDSCDDEPHTLRFGKLRSEKFPVRSLGCINPWANLEFLCFQEPRLDFPDQLEHALCLPAWGLRFLPKLKVLELWVSFYWEVSASAWLFRYEAGVPDGPPTITWRSCKHNEVALAPTVVEEWTRAVSQSINGQRKALVVNVSPFPETEKDMKLSRGSFIYQHLQLHRLVADPVTLAQIKAQRINKVSKFLRRDTA